MTSPTPNPQQEGDDLRRRAERILALYGTEHPYPSPYQGSEIKWSGCGLSIFRDDGDLSVALMDRDGSGSVEILRRNRFGEIACDYDDVRVKDANTTLAKILVLDELADA
jgi:hypothetical protein